jgi:drug/metabolite transporter (DMT)-like permease
LHLALGIGELFLVINSICYALYLVLSRPLFQRYRTDTAITWIFGFGALLLLPLGLRSIAHELPVAPSAAHASLAFIVLGPTVAAYFLNGFALRRAPASIVAVYCYVQPVVAALLAAWILDERIAAVTIAGAVLIAIGIAMVSLGPRRPEAVPEDGAKPDTGA